MERSRRRRRRRKPDNKSSVNKDENKKVTKSSNDINKEKSSNEKRNTDDKSSNNQRSRRRNRSRSNNDDRKEKDQIKKPINEIKYEDQKPNLLAELKSKLLEMGPVKYTEEDYIRYRFSVSEKYHDFTRLVYMTNSIEEARQCLAIYPDLKVFTNEGILAYPQPPINCKSGYYYVRDEKTNKEIFKHQSLPSAITFCGNEMIITDQNGNRVY